MKKEYQTPDLNIVNLDIKEQTMNTIIDKVQAVSSTAPNENFFDYDDLNF